MTPDDPPPHVVDERITWRLVLFFAAILCAIGLAVVFAPWDGASRKDLVAALGAVAWPIALVIALVLFKEPIDQLLKGVGPRITKLSVMKVELELKQATEPSHAAPAVLQELQAPMPAALVGDSSGQLRSSFAATEPCVYVEIDMGKGEEWLSSRVFILACLLERLRDLRCIVFLETRDGLARRFVGMASPAKVRWAFAMRWPFLEIAYTAAYGSVMGRPVPLPPDPIPNPPRITSIGGGFAPELSQEVFRQFLRPSLRNYSAASPGPDWTALGNSEWERASWMTGAVVKDVLGVHLDTASIPNATSIPPEKLVQLVIRERSPFVATLHSDGSFKTIVDRVALASALAASAN